MKTVIAIFFLFTSGVYAQSEKVMELGKQTFASCSLCHGADGKGAKAGDILMAPSLHDSEFVKSKIAKPLVAVILKGIVKEDSKYLQQMVPLEAALSDEQIAAVAAYIRKEFGGPETTIKPGDVKRWRSQYKSRSVSWKRSELAQVVARAETGPLLRNVSYSVYEGKWSKLPDFSTMEPVQRGELKDGKLTLDVVKDRKDNFGIVFEGDLKVAYTDTYEFSLLSDDGSALIIDGENVINHDGIHPATIRKGSEKLEAGEHTFKVLYFEGGGNEALGLSVEAKKIGEMSLSKKPVKKSQKKQKVYPPIILKPENDEAIVHRAFLPDAKPRAIGVGYPGGINLVWDADVLNLAYVWRGGFMDTAKHWNGRGSGSEPVGGPRTKIAHGLPLQQLESLDEPWVSFSEAKIKYERDVPNPVKEHTFNRKHPDYQFRGYRLDGNRFPTFRYNYKDIEVTDTFTPAISGREDALIRLIKFAGEAPDHCYFRISDMSPAVKKKDSDWISVGNLEIYIEGVEPTFRQSEGKKEVLALIDKDVEIKVTYRWTSPRKEAVK
ncbi:MAG: PA14 domain-containing protein [Verrucomicrobiales bacterium]|nr:PA14 domain-containing protein [Verrucomicrobiales bacterium]